MTRDPRIDAYVERQEDLAGPCAKRIAEAVAWIAEGKERNCNYQC